MKNILIISIALSFGFTQKITNVTQKIENGRVVINYDLKGNDKYYDITLSATKDGETISPFAIAGDVNEVSPGKNHEIWWEPVLEGRDLHGWTVSLEAEWNLFDMVFVKGGSFKMGCTSEQSDCDGDEKPVHTVTVSDFYMSATEVTQAQWKEVMGNNPSYFKGDNLPVEIVSWNDIQKFLKKLNQQSGKNYRLPTEAEWEYASRGGVETNGRSSQTQYAGSNNIDAVAWYSGNSGSKTHPVAQKQPNELGLYDMSGNVWEWCNDWYDEDYYSKSPQNNPQGANRGEYRVLRGGSWSYFARNCRVANRHGNYPDYRGSIVGFRLVRSAQ